MLWATDFDELDALETALTAVADVPLSCLSADELGEYMRRLQRLGAAMDALKCRVTAVAEAAGTHTLGPSRTIAAWAGSECSVDPAQVGRDRTLGCWLRGFATFTAAFQDGRITRRHVEQLKRLDTPRTRLRLVEAQDYLTDAAVSCAWRDFRRVVAQWLLAADPDGAEPREQVANRYLTLIERPDGTMKGTFQLDPLAAAAVTTAVRHRAEQLWRHDQTLDPADRRTRRQRCADALVELIANGFRRQDGTTPRPLVHVTMSPGVAEAMLARLEADDQTLGSDEVAADGPDGRCELADGTPVHPLFGLAALTSGVLRRLIMTAESEVIDLGRSVRDFPAHLRDALLAAHRSRCATPGCDAPPEWLQIDHIIPWARHGPTALHNGRPLCDPDNKAKTDTIPP